MNKVLEKSNVNYIDITKVWKVKSKGKYKVIDKRYFKDSNKNIYKLDNKYVVLDYSKEEKEIAKWLAKKFCTNVYMLPRVNYPYNIQTPDYLFKNEYWDLKTINGSNLSTIDRAINGKSKQAENFIIDISNSKITNQIADICISKIYNSKYRKWVNKIMLINNKKIIKIYQRK